ncbi:sugar phosphate isomerase/epimerase [Clostridium sp. 'deep sea']|uniref:sugar phosphate isomerase/epimerase n=1 Tax=Clostridium sp. 'deep sea' TaxID=2779445 RepID=UPI00189643F1|nr:sugar phosphate isomerase/epimerase [Clostridium sp. 'deep sea']QOR34731.1 sugar phosphate isomerase/epimerase [Clostridium sp. 'deep sea']
MVKNRFLIGHYGKYDLSKQDRDFREYFFGVEICSISDSNDIAELMKEAKKNNFSYGVHMPMRAGQWKLRDAQFLSKNKNCQKESYNYLEREIEYISQYKPNYILIHFPKPMLLDERVDWSSWRFADTSEFYNETDYPYEMFMQKSEEFFIWLTKQAKAYGFTPVLEFDLVNKYIYDNKKFYELITSYPLIKICLDIPRLHLQTQLDKYFKVDSFINQYAKHTYLVHLSNLSIEKGLNHYPALPSLSPKEGWADVETYLNKIKEHNNSFKLLYEHWSNAVNAKQLQECYDWIEGILS